MTILIAPLLALAGCGSSGHLPDIGEVKGVVTLEGGPLENAYVFFAPEDGRTSVAVTDDAGRYTLKYNRDTEGAKVGRHVVRITTLVPDEIDDEGKLVKPGMPERVPVRYNEQTELTAEVKSGSNEIDFPLAG